MIIQGICMPFGDWNPAGLIGQSFDGFKILRPLGAGGMATVYLAHDSSLDRLVALKFIASGLGGPLARERLLREARAIARLQHPNVVAVYRISEHGGHPYIAYEYVEGRHLDSLSKPVEWLRALRIALGLARGLAAAHKRGIVHRDVKPANVMLVEESFRTSRCRLKSGGKFCSHTWCCDNVRVNLVHRPTPWVADSAVGKAGASELESGRM